MQPALKSTRIAPPTQRCKAPIIAHVEVAPGYWQLKLHCPFIAEAGRPGQFVHILPPRAGFDPFLRRAFSIFKTDPDAIEVLYRAAGKGTTLLSSARVGDDIDLIGPLGQPFEVHQRDIILVGGGIGVPPLVFLAQHQLNQPSSSQSCRAEFPLSPIAFIGARSRNDVIGREEFQNLKVPLQIATDDGSAGHHGLVTDLLRGHLQSLPPSNANQQGQPQSPTVYSCGPWPMLRAVAQLCAEFKVPCQVSLEENMPCGIGVCNGCVVPVLQAGDDYGLFRRICVEGPVLWSHEVQWDHPLIQ